MFYTKLTSETFKNKGFHYPARKAFIAMAVSICETRAEASALDAKWSSAAVRTQGHPNC